MGLQFAVSTLSGFQFPNIPGDRFPPDDPADPEATPNADIPSIYANTDINFALTFSYLYTEGEEGSEEFTTVTIPAAEVRVVGELPYNGIEIVTETDTASVSGQALDIFTDEIFRFVFADGTEQNLPQVNEEDWLSIIKWQDPSVKETNVTYLFEVTLAENIYVATGPYSINLTQFVYWFFEPSLNRFQELVAESALRLKQ